MSRNIPFLLAGLLMAWGCTNQPDNINFLTAEEAEVSNSINGISYTVGNWPEISYQSATQSLGNHRAIITVPDGATMARVHLPWRRREVREDEKRLIIINPTTQDTLQNQVVRHYAKEYAEVIFEPQPGVSSYHFYYYPYATTGSYYPTVTYLTPLPAAENSWQEQYGNLTDAEYMELPAAKVTNIEAINAFNSFFPMEVPATQAELDSFLAKHPQPYYLFPEFRNNPVKMTKQLPYHWVTRALKNGLQDELKKGEYYVFQLAVYAPTMALEDVQVSFSDLTSSGSNIPASAFTCFNTTGVDLAGEDFSKTLNISAGKVQPLWLGLHIPEDIKADNYRGQIIVKPANASSDTVFLDFAIGNEQLANYGDDDPENLSRLRWLNSTLGSEDDFIIDPFTPIEVEDKTLKVLGREIELDATGLPKSINSFFKPAMTGMQPEAEPILAAPISFQALSNGNPETWESQSFSIESKVNTRAAWQVKNNSEHLQMIVKGSLEYDGMLEYQLTIIPKTALEVEDMGLTIPYQEAAAKYILGLGFKGRQRPATIDWQWDVTRHQEGVWLGNVNKGLQYVLRDLNYQRPLNTNFYQSQPLNLPPSWYNEGKGGIRIKKQGGQVIADNYSGARQLTPGDTLNFVIRFLITPFKPINTESHFNTRFVHKYIPVDSVKAYGGTVVNVHHANEINPYINYPFYNLEAQKAYIDEAHAKGVKVKLYNTIRELTYKAYEFYPMRSLGNEIYNDGEGGGHPWLQEHLEDDYHKAWHAWRVNDASILNKGTSRWTNYYIEGLNWLAKNQEIDGLYLDDIAFSRETVKRIVAVLNKNRPEIIIDLHSANQFNPRDGFINSAFLYMEHFPYMTRLWFGEYFEYDKDPDYWLTEVSGIPFGLTGEMLQDGGHPYRGMVYGMTTRVYGKYNPQPIWQLFDDFKIMESEMLGYWLEDVPVKSNNANLPVTVYRQDKAILLAIGSWSDRDEKLKLEIDWPALGVTDMATTKWSIPAVKGLQAAQQLKANEPVIVPANQGLFVLVEF